MAFIVERARLYAAQVNAKSMGLDGTAGRLEVLRKHLRRYHKLSDPQRGERLRWGMAKLNETKTHVENEATELGMKPEVWQIQDGSGGMNRLAKLVGVAGAMALMGDAIRKLVTEECGHLHALKVIAVAAAAVVAVFRIADIFFSTGLDDSVKGVRKTIDRCTASLSSELSLFNTGPRTAEKDKT